MNLDFFSFFRGDLNLAPAQGIQEFFRAILMRTNFVPVLRHRIGWRGLKQSVAGVESWTARINGFAGVFGVSFQGLDPGFDRIRGRFALCYFPHPEEDLVEVCSLHAIHLTQDREYFPHIREFSAYPDFSGLFKIGNLFLSVDPCAKSLGFSLEALSFQRSISETGVCLPQDGQMVTLIESGGWDRNFPAFETASGFFNVLAASVTFNLGQPPVRLREYDLPGFQGVEAADGVIREVPADDIRNHWLVLEYGEGGFEDAAGRGEGAIQGHGWVSGDPIPERFRDRIWWRAHQLDGGKTIDRKTLGLDERPPLILLTGFLGSGKTSFLTHFIEYQTQHSRFVAVIQNEIGSVGLDGKLLDYTVTEIDEGCVCCSLVGSLKHAVRGILSDFTPDCIIVETTGLANPFNLLEEMGELEELVRFDCTLTVVDLLNIESTLKAYPIAADQIRGADILMMNKKDAVAPEYLKVVAKRLQSLNSRAPQFPAVNGDLPPGLVLAMDAPSLQPFQHKNSAIPHCSHARSDLWAKSIRIHGPIHRETFLHRVSQFPPSIFRAKGILEFSGSPQPMLFQFVAGRFDISIFSGASRDRFLTLIGKGDDPEQVAFALGFSTALN